MRVEGLRFGMSENEMACALLALVAAIGVAIATTRALAESIRGVKSKGRRSCAPTRVDGTRRFALDAGPRPRG